MGDKKTFVRRFTTWGEGGSKFELRQAEHLGRDECITSIKKSITKYSDIVNNVNTKDVEKYEHLTDEQRKVVNDKCDATKIWLESEMTKQNASTLDVDPVLTMAKIKEERKSVISTCKPVVNTPKPKPVEKKDEEEEATKEGEEGGKNGDEGGKSGEEGSKMEVEGEEENGDGGGKTDTSDDAARKVEESSGSGKVDAEGDTPM